MWCWRLCAAKRANLQDHLSYLDPDQGWQDPPSPAPSISGMTMEMPLAFSASTPDITLMLAMENSLKAVYLRRAGGTQEPEGDLPQRQRPAGRAHRAERPGGG